MQRNREKQQIGKTRDLFKKIRDTKGTFHEKDGHNKGQKWQGLKGAEHVKKYGKNTKKNYIRPS